jgi:hypothetical protein
MSALEDDALLVCHLIAEFRSHLQEEGRVPAYSGHIGLQDLTADTLLTVVQKMTLSAIVDQADNSA